MSINIKPSKKGSLHEALGVDKDEKIPTSKLKIKEGDSAGLKKKKQFAINAKHFKKAEDGLNFAPEGTFEPTKPFTSVLDYDFSNGDYSNTPSQISTQKKPKYPWGDLLAPGLTLIDSLFPDQKQQDPIVRPQNSYNPYQYGNGSQAIAKNGKKMPDGGRMGNGDNKPTYNPSNYRPFTDPKQAQEAYDEGWMPVASPTTSSTTYQNNYWVNNDVVLPGKQEKGKMSIIGHNNGVYDVQILDGNGKMQGEPILTGANYNDVHNYFTNQQSNVANRFRQIQKTNPEDVYKTPPIYATKLKEGGKLKASQGLQVEDDKYKHLSESTILFGGDLHKDGGTDIHFNGTPIEVEKGETATMGNDGSLNVMGNMKVPGTKIKFKTLSKEIAEKEMKASKTGDKGINLVNSNSPTTPYDKFSFNSGTALFDGSKQMLKQTNLEKESLIHLQDEMLSYADSKGQDAGKLFGKDGLKMPDGGKKKSLAEENNNPGNLKYANQAGATKGRGGFAKFDSYEAGLQALVGDIKAKQTGKTSTGLNANSTIQELMNVYAPKGDGNDPVGYAKFLADNLGVKPTDKIGNLDTNKLAKFITRQEDVAYASSNDNGYTPKMPNTYKTNTPTPAYNYPGLTKNSITPDVATPQTPYQYQPQGGFDIIQPNNKIPPSNAEGLNPIQVLPELFAAAKNKPASVFMQQYTPDLYQDYQVSFQDRVNANNSTLNGIRQTLSNNPEALSNLAGQTYQANLQALGDEFRTNQGISNQVSNQNIQLMNQAEMQNLQLADQQYVRQQTTNAKVDSTNQSILNSLSSKYLQNNLQNRTLQAYENMSNYRMNNETGQFDYYGPDAQFQEIQPIGNQYQSTRQTLDATGVPIKTSVSTPSQAQQTLLQDKVQDTQYKKYKRNPYIKLTNGGIIKAYKNNL